MARRRPPRGRPIDGVLLLDKPHGASSNEALQQVKRLYGAAKAGHTGSLDPLATGLLPICFGEATKLSAFLLDADKMYRVEGYWGEKTNTGDGEGEVIERVMDPLKPEAIEAQLPRFRGAQKQIPPMYSAVRHEGKRLYELAREGIEIEREARDIRIDHLELVSAAVEERLFTLDVRCSKGTYIRTLVEDIAEAAGGYAHVSSLRRLEVGAFRAEGMVSMEQLLVAADRGREVLDALLMPITEVFQAWPQVQVDSSRAFYLSRGQAVRVADAPNRGFVAVNGVDGQFLGVGVINDDGLVQPKRWIAAR